MFHAYPMPKLESRELEREAVSSQESYFKMKLLDFTERIKNMSAFEFDKLCVGRIEKQTEESCLQISKVLFQGIKLAIRKQSEDEKAKTSVS
mmetsp:Transcript_5756/g.9859  ORF Transcript_5756/g.9859 Transcript_5756/m.9859 type:complete len:92 (-) Transcript_5756:103-378(-)